MGSEVCKNWLKKSVGRFSCWFSVKTAWEMEIIFIPRHLPRQQTGRLRLNVDKRYQGQR
ncbi:hypothetical protein HanIR_Chr16g0811751 [Helianthus annuus]|nr:hypothetical protein HanIR_Chr16g0811751 [Helianthus annuus]